MIQGSLTAGQIQRLRAAHPYEEDPGWLAEVVRTGGRLAGNLRFLQRERERSAEAMGDLMREVGVRRVTSCHDALELIRLACVVFAPESGFRGTARFESECQLRITNGECRASQPRAAGQRMGVTACPSWHRRRGWIDALGVAATDTVLKDAEWGYPACAAMVQVQRLPD